MKAIRLHAHGGPENITIDDVADAPAPRRGEIRIAVRAMALNHMDIWVRNGMPAIKQALPFVMGCDVAGDVTDVGDEVDDFTPGDRVMLTPMMFCGCCGQCLAGEQSQCRDFQMRGEHVDGFFSEFTLVNARSARKIAPHVRYEAAAAFSLTFLTAWRMLVTRAAVKPGEFVLIHGIGGGVSVSALEICRRIGARAIVTSGEDWKLERARELGAVAGFNYKTQDVAKAVYASTGKAGVDVVIDSVGGSTWPVSIKTTRMGGRIVVCGATAGGNPPADLTRIFWKQLNVLGSTMGNMREFTEVARLLDSGDLKPVIDLEYDAADIRAAHERLESAGQFGKIVLRW